MESKEIKQLKAGKSSTRRWERRCLMRSCSTPLARPALQTKGWALPLGECQGRKDWIAPEDERVAWLR